MMENMKQFHVVSLNTSILRSDDNYLLLLNFFWNTKDLTGGKVNMHDFVDRELGKAIPYGVYDIGANVGCVSVGIDHDTAQFAVNAIRRWRDTMGRERYP